MTEADQMHATVIIVAMAAASSLGGYFLARTLKSLGLSVRLLRVVVYATMAVVYATSRFAFDHMYHGLCEPATAVPCTGFVIGCARGLMGSRVGKK